MSRERSIWKKRPVVFRYSPEVSRALWPRAGRYSVLTNRATQQRRLLITKAHWYTGRNISVFARLSGRRILSVLLVSFSILSLLALGAFLAAFVLHPWSLLFWLVMVWTISALLIVWLLVREVRFSDTSIEVSRMRRTEDMEEASEERGDFPETPLPLSSTPMVRVMETIDLSTSNVKHFLHEKNSEQENE